MAHLAPHHDPSWRTEEPDVSVMQIVFAVLLIVAFGFLAASMLGLAG